MIDIQQIQIYVFNFLTILMAFIAFRFFMTWLKATEHCWKIYALQGDAERIVKQIEQKNNAISTYDIERSKENIKLLDRANQFKSDFEWMKNNYIELCKKNDSLEKEISLMNSKIELLSRAKNK